VKIQHLEVTTMIGCKVACVYCPQDKISSRYSGVDRMMAFDDFKTYVQKVPRHVVLHFTGFAEAFLNPSCMDMVEYAARRGHPIYLSTTLTGMTLEDARRLSRLTYYEFQIHLPSAGKLMNLAVDDRYLSVLSELVTAGVITDSHFHGDEVHPVVGAWLREHGIEFSGISIQDRAGNLDTTEVAARVKNPITTAASPTGRLRCDRIYQNVLLPNGDVVLCCMDWSAEHVLGNLRRDRFEDLHRSEGFRRVRRGMKDPGTKVLCRTCTHARAVTVKDRAMMAIEDIPGFGPIAARSLRRLRRVVEAQLGISSRTTSSRRTS
jgi:hypothetical protein